MQNRYNPYNSGGFFFKNLFVRGSVKITVKLLTGNNSSPIMTSTPNTVLKVLSLLLRNILSVTTEVHDPE